MLGVAGSPQANLSGAQIRGTHVPGPPGSSIADPNPQFPMAGGMPTTTNNQAICNVGKQGWDAGGAVFSRLEGITWDKGVIYFTSTQGGGDPGDDRLGHVSRVAGPARLREGHRSGVGVPPDRGVLEVVYQSARTRTICTCPTTSPPAHAGTLILCEDNTPPTGQTNALQALTRWGS